MNEENYRIIDTIYANILQDEKFMEKHPELRSDILDRLEYPALPNPNDILPSKFINWSKK
jgi:hypothetical protein